MNKAQLVEEVDGKAGLTKKETLNVIDAVTETIRDALAKGEKVAWVGFGTFQVMERKARRGVNPQTRKTVQISAKKVPKFRPGKGLEEAVQSIQEWQISKGVRREGKCWVLEIYSVGRDKQTWISNWARNNG